MRIKGISAVALVLLASLVATGIGCGKTTPSIGMMDAMPLSTVGFGFFDYMALRTDEDLKPMLDQIYVEELLERSGLDSAEQLDALSMCAGGIFLMEGSFDLDSVEAALDENGYERDDNYKGIRCWRVGAGGYTALVSSSLIITGKEGYVKSCIDVIMGDDKSLYDDEDFRDIADRLPNGIHVLIMRGASVGYWGTYKGLSISGVSMVKKDSDTMRATALLKFDSAEDAENAEDDIEEDIRGAEEFHTSNISVTRVGRYVRVVFDADIDQMGGESELERARAELHQAQTAIAACMAEAGRAALDSDVVAWDGSPGQATCTVDSTVYDAAEFLTDTFNATYDVDIDGQIYNGTPISWSGIAWDNVNLGWVEVE